MQRYTELCSLNITHSGNIYLVRQEETGLLAVRKTVEASLYPLYERLRHIRHPSLMQILDVELQEDACIVIEEYIFGQTFEALLQQGMRFHAKDVRQYLLTVCDAVQTLHVNQIIHMDINPGNIMLNNDGILKLCDFDIAKILEEHLQTDTNPLGTYYYAPPEQFGYAKTDQQSDIYAIGKLASTLLTGTDEVFYSRFNRLGKVIARATAVDKNDRYASVAQMKAALTRQSAHKVTHLLQYICGFQKFTVGHFLTSIIACYLLFDLHWYVVQSELTSPFAIFTFFLFPWVLFADICHISHHLLKLQEKQKWFRIVIGFIIMTIGMVIYG